MAEKTNSYKAPGSSKQGPDKVKIFEEKGSRLAWWIIPLLLLVAAILIWAFVANRHPANTAAQSAAVTALPDLHFDTDQATLSPTDQTNLATVADRMNANPDLKLRIAGYTDTTGSAAHNETLSDRRAASVRQFLTSKGVDSSRLTGEGHGQANPVNANATAAEKADNRRVSLQLF